MKQARYLQDDSETRRKNSTNKETNQTEYIYDMPIVSTKDA